MSIPDNILLQVEKPARYLGNELNMVVKNPDEVKIRFAFCFPDAYEVGMSHLGLQILYYFLNERNDTYCERAFAPWIDMEKIMREQGIRLSALESQQSLDKFDFVGFTLQYEMSYTNIINMLDLSGIPVLSKDRRDSDPIICAGGPCAYNPEPLADFIDFFYIGEGEVMYNDILDMYKEHKEKGGCREDFLKSLMSLPGMYVPRFYEAHYNDDGTLKAFEPLLPEAPEKIKKVFVSDMKQAYFPEKQLVPLLEAVHERVTLEVFRGCIRGCRFCQAGYVYRPVREKAHEQLIEQAAGLINCTGHEEISLVSLSTGDYREFQPLAVGLLDKFAGDKVSLSLPSLRIDAFNLELMNRVQEVRKSSLTFAPEAGTQRLRDVINKNITEEEILNGCHLAFQGGWNRVKLYFMTGIPTEDTDDLKGIARLCEKIVEEYYSVMKKEENKEMRKRNRPVSLVISAACFVPKPFTPFQWVAQESADGFRKRIFTIKDSIQKKQVRVNYHSPEVALIEGVIARGDRRVGQVIYRAWELGARFDGWGEHFKYELWDQALKETDTPGMSFYTNRKRPVDELLPWDHIDPGISKAFLIREQSKALQEATTPNCRQHCGGCGIWECESYKAEKEKCPLENKI